MNRHLPVAGAVTVGTLALALALVASLADSPSVLEWIGRDDLVLGFAGFAGVLGLFVLTYASVRPSTNDGLELPSRGATATSDAERVTAPIDRALERRDVGESPVDRGRRIYFQNESREAARDAAVIVLRERYGVDSDTAAERVDDGTWTDDPRAAAYLGPDVELPLRYRLEDWAFGARRQRGLEATIDELEALASEPEADPR